MLVAAESVGGRNGVEWGRPAEVAEIKQRGKQGDDPLWVYVLHLLLHLLSSATTSESSCYL